MKSLRAVTPGVVIGRLDRRSRQPSAEIVNLKEIRRSRQIEATDREISALFN
jgi:hypothetical protein